MRTLVALLIVLNSVACDRDAAEDPQAPAAAAPTTSAPAKDEPEPEPVELPASIPEGDVQAVVDGWLAAQNKGDFDAYSASYADKLEGIKRVGARMYRYNRDGWLEDRKRMFKKKMRVTAADMQIQTSPATAVVLFEQTWSSGNYKDVGPKQLIVARQNGELRIAREEMLQSHVLGDEAEKRAYDPQAMALLIDGAIVLDTAPKSAWAKGEATLVSRPDTATRQLDADASGFANWVGRELELFDAEGEACEAKITDLALIARVIPHFSTVAMWDGEFDAKSRASDREVAAQIWRMAAESASGGGVQLIGKLDSECAGALWARPKGAAATPLPARRHGGPTARTVMSAFTDLPGYHDLQSDFTAYGHSGAWHEANDAQVEVLGFGSHISVSAVAGRGCGDFEGDLWGVWRKGEHQSLILQSDENGAGVWRFAPKAAAQIGDVVYFTDGERVVSQVKDQWQMLWHVQSLNYDCGC